MTELPWAEVNDPGWQPSFTPSKEGLDTTFSGACPRCTHGMSFKITNATPPTAGLRDGPEELTMLCACGHPHSGHPDGDNSCGAYWPYEADLTSP